MKDPNFKSRARNNEEENNARNQTLASQGTLLTTLNLDEHARMVPAPQAIEWVRALRKGDLVFPRALTSSKIKKNTYLENKSG